MAAMMVTMMAARGGVRAFRSDAICVLRILRVGCLLSHVTAHVSLRCFSRPSTGWSTRATRAHVSSVVVSGESRDFVCSVKSISS